MWSAYEKLGRLGDHVNPGKVFSDIKLKSYETALSKKIATPISAKKKKEEEDKIKRLGNQPQPPKRKNSIHGTDSGSKNTYKEGLMSLLRKFG